MIMLLQLPCVSPFASLHPAPCTTSGNPPTIVHVNGSMCIKSLAPPFPILYYTPPWLFCNCLFVLLNPLTSSPIPPHTPPIGQPSKYSLHPWFCLCSSYLFNLFFYIQLLIDKNFFCQFIVHSFDLPFLK